MARTIDHAALEAWAGSLLRAVGLVGEAADTVALLWLEGLSREFEVDVPA